MTEAMSKDRIYYALLANRHHGLTEGVRSLLETTFDVVLMKLIVVSVHDGPSASRSALEAGANGFVLKRAIATDLLPAVDAVLAGQHYVSPDC